LLGLLYKQELETDANDKLFFIFCLTTTAFSPLQITANTQVSFCFTSKHM